ncbi:MAG: hypothetical protein H6Q33_1082 [Deltaproteobacteria bacterium]|jgi:hypothetical protein|nr:hypothetical protein [Deltaproteobacteria bacterium]
MRGLVGVLSVLLVPALSWAGGAPVSRAPTMDEVGLITLGVALAGAGVALLRRK